MQSYLQNIPKGVEFTLYFTCFSHTALDKFMNREESPVIFISKDGAATAPVDNTPTYLGNDTDMTVAFIALFLLLQKWIVMY